MQSILESPPPEIHVAGHQQQWFAGYSPKGPLFTTDRSKAYIFPDETHAQNVLGMDERLKGYKVVPA